MQIQVPTSERRGLAGFGWPSFVIHEKKTHFQVTECLIFTTMANSSLFRQLPCAFTERGLKKER